MAPILVPGAAASGGVAASAAGGGGGGGWGGGVDGGGGEVMTVVVADCDGAGKVAPSGSSCSFGSYIVAMQTMALRHYSDLMLHDSFEARCTGTRA